MLANLPRTRPQRTTARRAASRRQSTAASDEDRSAGTTTARPTAAKPARTTKAKPARRTAAKAAPKTRRAPAKRKAPKAAAEEIPRQGFACEEERVSGAVAPPGAAELVGTAAEIVGEIARFGITGGERVLRDVLGRLGR